MLGVKIFVVKGVYFEIIDLIKYFISDELFVFWVFGIFGWFEI